MDKPFRYPERIPAARANAIRRLISEKDNWKAWEVLRLWVQDEGVVKVLQDIAMILEFNGLDVHAQAAAMARWSPLLLVERKPCETCEHYEVVIKHPDLESGYCHWLEEDVSPGPGCSDHEEKKDEKDPGAG